MQERGDRGNGPDGAGRRGTARRAVADRCLHCSFDLAGESREEARELTAGGRAIVVKESSTFQRGLGQTSQLVEARVLVESIVAHAHNGQRKGVPQQMQKLRRRAAGGGGA
jgi:hypothetical protein